MTLNYSQISAICVVSIAFYDGPVKGYGIYRGRPVYFSCTKQPGCGLAPDQKLPITEEDCDNLPFYEGEYEVDFISSLSYWKAIVQHAFFRLCVGCIPDREELCIFRFADRVHQLMPASIQARLWQSVFQTARVRCDFPVI